MCAVLWGQNTLTQAGEETLIRAFMPWLPSSKGAGVPSLLPFVLVRPPRDPGAPGWSGSSDAESLNGPEEVRAPARWGQATSQLSSSV